MRMAHALLRRACTAALPSRRAFSVAWTPANAVLAPQRLVGSLAMSPFGAPALALRALPARSLFSSYDLGLDWVVQPLSLDSVLRKRRRKMNKHKLEKRRRKLRDQGRGKK